MFTRIRAQLTMTEDCQRQNRLRLRRLSTVPEEYVPSTVDLPEHGQVVVGRSKEAQVKLDSPRHPNMISRRHAVLRADGNSLFLIDLESTNGVFVNGKKVHPNEDIKLVSGDRVVFGIPSPPGGTDFEFRVVPCIDGTASSTPSAALCASQDSCSPLSEQVEPSAKRLCLRNDGTAPSDVARLRVELARMQRRLVAMENKPSQGTAEVSIAMAQLEKEKKAMELQLRAKLEKEAVKESKRREQEILAEAQHREDELKRRNEEEKARIQEEAQVAVRQREEELQHEMERKKEELQRRAKQIEEEHLQQIEALEAKLKEADSAHELLKVQLEEHAKEEVDSVRAERERVEAELKLALKSKQEASQVLCLQLVELEREQDAKVSAAVATARQDAAQELTQSLKAQHDAELEQLQSELSQQVRQQQALAEELAQRDKEREKLESELQRRRSDGEKLSESLNCSICCQMFVYAHTLPCSHSFCEHCIFQWLDAKPQKRLCPVCREKLVSDPVPSVVLNQQVENALMVAGDSAATREWNEVAEERKAFHEKRKAAAKQKAHPAAVPLVPTALNVVLPQIVANQALANPIRPGIFNAFLPQNLFQPVNVQPQTRPAQNQPIPRQPQPRAQPRRTNTSRASNVILIQGQGV